MIFDYSSQQKSFSNIFWFLRKIVCIPIFVGFIENFLKDFIGIHESS